jgi:hypothetical protein
MQFRYVELGGVQGARGSDGVLDPSMLDKGNASMSLYGKLPFATKTAIWL